MWTNLESLKPGQSIGIIRANLKRVEGQFERVTDVAITLRADVQVRLLIRLYRKLRVNPAARGAVGAAIGAVAGAILTRTAGERFGNEGQDVPKGAWIRGGGIGAGVAALTGREYQILYQRSAMP